MESCANDKSRIIGVILSYRIASACTSGVIRFCRKTVLRNQSITRRYSAMASLPSPKNAKNRTLPTIGATPDIIIRETKPGVSSGYCAILPKWECTRAQVVQGRRGRPRTLPTGKEVKKCNGQSRVHCYHSPNRYVPKPIWTTISPQARYIIRAKVF